jgi:hypothetical protein
MGTITGDVERDFEHDGPFIGAAYGVPLSHWVFDGLLSFNLAVAFLDGEVTERTSNVRITFNDGTSVTQPAFETVLEGDTVGLSLGLSWRGGMPVEGLSYLLGIDGYRYDFGGDTVKQAGLPDRDVDFDFDETVVNFRAGLAYAF